VRIIFATASAIILSGLVPEAHADGVPSAAYAERPVLNFGGGYIGLNAGAAWGNSGFSTDPGCPSSATNATFCGAPPDPSAPNGTAVAASGTGDLSSAGFTGGIQGGYNWQFGNIVFGGEGDFGAFNLSKSANPTGVFPFPFLGTAYALNESMSTDWLITLRGRLGYTVAEHLLLYATAGVALTDFSFSSSYSDNAIGPTFPGGTGATSISTVRTGWTVGGGGEWLLDNRWSIKAEYLYLDFGSTNFAVATSNTADFTQTMVVDADLSAQVARVGINYRH
jgi:outer membrane immunogenic protein